MKKKILTLLVLLMTAVSGAWATDYYVVGTMTGWQKNDQYKMTLNASAATTEYQLGIALAATDEFKVIGVDGDNPWGWYPSGDNYGHNGELTAEGLYTIYFRPNGDGGSDWFYNCIYLAEGAYLAETSGEWTLTQPAFDVELEVEYYPLATLATLPAAAEGVVEGTDAALLTPGTSTEGTFAYALGTSEAPTGQWSETIPTTEGLEAGEYYVWYKVVGDAEHSDSQPQSIAVTIAEAPAYAVTIDDAGVDASNWQATPAEPKTGQTVTLSYNGKKKVKSITIEKAAAPAATVTTAPTAKTGVKAGQNEAIVNAGTAEGGTMMYAVTTDATQPASTDGFSATVPTAEGLTAGTYYVWYYVKADDSHTDSEISATGIEVTIEAAGPTLAETLTTAGMTVKVNYNYGGENYCTFVSNGDGTYTFQSGGGYGGGDDECAKALVVENGKLVFKQNYGGYWEFFGFSVTFDTSNNTYIQWKGDYADDYNPSFISVEVNGTQIAVTAAQ